jgi:hypothetical protein
VFYLVAFQEPALVKHVAEKKVADFLGDRFSVEIGEVRDGIFRDMVLEDVVLGVGKIEEGKVFHLERMEISYRLWQVLLEKIKFLPGKDEPLKYIFMYFGDKNPFVRGFIKLYSYPERIEVLGHVSFAMFADETKRGIKGVLLKREDGKYDCDLLWDGSVQVTGTLDPGGKEIDLGVIPVLEQAGKLKIKGSVSEGRDISVYSRLDRVSLYGAQTIGDLWISYKNSDTPSFSIKAENLVIDKRPFWDFFAGGRFVPANRTIILDSVKWGDGLILTGRAEVQPPYEGKLKLKMQGMKLSGLAKMLGEKKTPLFGEMEGEINFTGSLRSADVDGRLFIGKGVMGSMEFRSIFATLSGKLPVIKVTDSRVVKDGGNLIVTGQIDFSKMRENKALEGLIFQTDNKVAVWEDWQISKEKDTVEARRDKLTISTAVQDDVSKEDTSSRSRGQKEMGVKYKLDTNNSIKLDFEEEDDFFGLEHKIQF